MSFNCQARVNRQSYSHAAMVMELPEMKDVVSSDLLKDIKGLGLPGLSFDVDQEWKLDALITRQLCEMVLACTRGGVLRQR